MVTIPPRLDPLLEQYDFALERLMRRLDGLTDNEYLWEPVAGCWSVRPREQCKSAHPIGGDSWVLDNERPPPEPPPFTTIAWRLCHLAHGLTMRADYTIGSRSMMPSELEVPANAEAGVESLVTSGRFWRRALVEATDADLDQIGRSQFPWGLDPTLPLLDIVWWVNQELLHHGGEIALLRDLYRAQPR